MSYDPAKKSVSHNVTIISDGSGMYSDIQAAFTAEGAGKAYLIRGSFVASGSIGIPASSYLVFQNVTITFTDAYLYIISGNNNVVAEGKLTLTGSGNSEIRQFFGTAGNDCDLSRLLIDIVPAGAGLTKGSAAAIGHAIFQGTRSSYNCVIHDVEYDITEGIVVYMDNWYADHSEMKFLYTNSKNIGDDIWYGHPHVAGANWNLLFMNVQNCGSSGGTERPLALVTNANYNCVVGVNRAAGTILNNGTGNDLYVAV